MGETKMISRISRGVIHRMRRALRSPFRSPRPETIVHCTYHKMGTKWFTSVLAAIANQYGLSVQCIDNNIDELQLDNDIIVFDHSDLASQSIESCVGSHMLRDLRDVIVSGYFYHLWTKEEWALVPKREFGGLNYQEHLKSLSQHEGILAEIERFAQYAIDRRMREWDYGNPQFLELKYENVFGNEENAFRLLFSHYGFTPNAIESSIAIARKFSFDAVRKTNRETTQRSHLRSGVFGQWNELFTNTHKNLFKETLGDLLVLTGYEKGFDWLDFNRIVHGVSLAKGVY